MFINGRGRKHNAGKENAMIKGNIHPTKVKLGEESRLLSGEARTVPAASVQADLSDCDGGCEGVEGREGCKRRVCVCGLGLGLG